MSNDPTRTEELSEDACWSLLRAGEVARLAVVVQDHPEIFPVNYVVDHGSVVFRTAEGTKVHAALSESAVALESDGVDAPEKGSGSTAHAWSVVLKGTARQITDTNELMNTTELPLTPWQTGAKGKFVRVTPTEITGRRFPVASPREWDTTVQDAPHAADE